MYVLLQFVFFQNAKKKSWMLKNPSFFPFDCLLRPKFFSKIYQDLIFLDRSGHFTYVANIRLPFSPGSHRLSTDSRVEWDKLLYAGVL